MMVVKKGQHLSRETEFKRGHKIWLGKKHSEASKQKMKKPKLKEFTEEHKRKISEKIKKAYLEGRLHGGKKGMIPWNKGKKILQVSGENHWNWQGGKCSINYMLRRTAKWQIWRNLIFLRDNFTCQNPNCKYCKNQIGVKLHPHHKKPLALYPELAFRIDNGITYCAEFHLKSGLHSEIQVKERIIKHTR